MENDALICLSLHEVAAMLRLELFADWAELILRASAQGACEDELQLLSLRQVNDWVQFAAIDDERGLV